MPVGFNPARIAVDTVFNRIYVANLGSDSVSVIDGASSTVLTTIHAVGNGPSGVAVDPSTHRIYVSSQFTDDLVAIDGNTNAISATVDPSVIGQRFPGQYLRIAANPLTHRVYVTDASRNRMAVLVDPPGPIDFCSQEYETSFFDLRNGPEIHDGVDLGGTGRCAVNFKGTSGAAGDTWLTIYEPTMFGIDDGGLCLSAEVLSSRFDNAKGAGLLALATGQGGKALLVLIVNNGKTDRITFYLVDTRTGKLDQLASNPLGGIAENTWYTLGLRLQRSGSTLFINTAVSRGAQAVPGGLLQFTGNWPALAAQGLDSTGFVGLGAWAKSAVVNSSATNFLIRPNCETLMDR